MPSASVLIVCEFGYEDQTVNDLNTLAGVDATRIAGAYDIIAKVIAESTERLSKIIGIDIKRLDRIRKNALCIFFFQPFNISKIYIARINTVGTGEDSSTSNLNCNRGYYGSPMMRAQHDFGPEIVTRWILLKLLKQVLQYPSHWEVSPAENRFETIVAEFISPDMSFGQVQLIDVRIIEGVRDAADLVGDFGEFIDLSLNSAGNTIPEFDIEEEVECGKYSIGGAEDTCSVLYSRAFDFTSDFKLAVLQVSGLSSDDVYTVTYTSTLNEFDKNLPQAEQIINSFQITTAEMVMVKIATNNLVINQAGSLNYRTTSLLTTTANRARSCVGMEFTPQ